MSCKVNVLMSYPYFTRGAISYLKKKDPSDFRLIVDSGAYTAWSGGKQIDIKEYIKFLKSLPQEWDMRAVQLDVIGNPQGTYENWQTMLSAGLSGIMPVFTRGADPEVLDEFYKFADVVMFGGIVKGKYNREYIKWFMEQNKSRKVHWLGFVNAQFIKKYSPYSVDSSAVTSTQRYATVQFYSGGGVMKSITRKDFATSPPHGFVESCIARGFTMAEILALGKEAKWHGNVQQGGLKGDVGYASFFNFVHHVARSVDVERNIGTLMYLAVALENHVIAAFDAFDFIKRRGTLV